jgi:hypothetical protein
MKNVRNWIVVNAMSRSSAGPMKHRATPKKSAKNSTRDFLELALEESDSSEEVVENTSTSKEHET